MLNVELIGGPFDGHHQACLLTSGELPSHVIRLVCDDAFRQLDEATQPKQLNSQALRATDLIYSLVPNATYSRSPSPSTNSMCCYAKYTAVIARRLTHL
jgi:hypothetical protein